MKTSDFDKLIEIFDSGDRDYVIHEESEDGEIYLYLNTDALYTVCFYFDSDSRKLNSIEVI